MPCGRLRARQFPHRRMPQEWSLVFKPRDERPFLREHIKLGSKSLPRFACKRDESRTGIFTLLFCQQCAMGSCLAVAVDA